MSDGLISIGFAVLTFAFAAMWHALASNAERMDERLRRLERELLPPATVKDDH